MSSASVRLNDIFLNIAFKYPLVFSLLLCFCIVLHRQPRRFLRFLPMDSNHWLLPQQPGVCHAMSHRLSNIVVCCSLHLSICCSKYIHSRSTCCICCSKYSCRSTCCIWPWFWSVANSQMFLWLCKGTVSRAFLLLLCNKFTLPGPLIHKKTIAIISNEKCKKISHTFTSTKCVL